MKVDRLLFCPFSRLYTRQPCNPHLSMHTDIPVGDVLVVEDLEQYDLAGDLYAERFYAGKIKGPSHDR